MAASISSTALKCKSQFENSLFLHRIGLDVITRPQTNDPHFEEKFLLNVSTMKKRQHNAILAEYYTLGEYLFEADTRFRSGNSHNRIASFIYRYYKDEPEAIEHLENVTPTFVERLND